MLASEARPGSGADDAAIHDQRSSPIMYLMTSTAADAADTFYDVALERIRRFMLLLGIVLTLTCWARFGGRVALGFAGGCLIAYVNFYWLKRVVSGLADRATSSGDRVSGSGVVTRFLLRYFFMGLGGYVIFQISRASLYGLLAGLFLPVLAIGCEAGYELYMTLRRGL